jgi:hypothetical protein
MRRCSTNNAVGQVFAYDITTRNVPCQTARSFIVAINNRLVRLKVQNTYYRGYICHPAATGASRMEHPLYARTKSHPLA